MHTLLGLEATFAKVVRKDHVQMLKAAPLAPAPRKDAAASDWAMKHPYQDAGVPSHCWYGEKQQPKSILLTTQAVTPPVRSHKILA